jgi:hypothetical protein
MIFFVIRSGKKQPETTIAGSILNLPSTGGGRCAGKKALGDYVSGRENIRMTDRCRCFAGSYWLLVMAVALIAALMQCSAPHLGGGSCRTAQVKVLVDPDIATDPSWRAAVLSLFDKTNATMRQWAGVTLRVDTIVLWDIEKSPSYKSLLLGDCLMKEQPKGKYDILVYIGTTGSPPPMTEGMPFFEAGYVFLQQPAPLSARSIDAKTYFSLVHWAAHIFGAVHCYFDKSNITIMNPYIHDGSMLDIDAAGASFEPKFHKGNVRIMTALSRRPFDDHGWTKSLWPPIQKTYEKVRFEFNPWRIDESGEMVGYQADAFHEGNLYLCMSSWASLCGMREVAIAYLDSVARVVVAMKKTCIKQGVAGSTRICTVCGYDTASIDNWYQTRLFTLELRRSQVFLRGGSVDSADSCFEGAIGKIPPQLATLKEKYISSYAFHKERFGRIAAMVQPRSK